MVLCFATGYCVAGTNFIMRSQGSEGGFGRVKLQLLRRVAFESTVLHAIWWNQYAVFTAKVLLAVETCSRVG